VVVSFWATWCAPCVKEFPELVALAGKRRDVAFVSVSLDEPADREAVEAFVAEKRPPFPVYLKAKGPDEAFINAADRDWSGVIPATLVLDRGGRKVTLIEGEHDTAQIEKALDAVKP
jgi:thiol-disulfide isomerase/thioredoxin